MPGSLPAIPGGVPPHGVDEPFRRPVAIGLAAVTACSLTLAVALVVSGAQSPVESAGADAFSRSALGHHAFVDLLRASGVPVVISRFASAERARPRAVLMIAEPRLSATDATRQRRLEGMLSAAGSVLIVLPKWSGTGRGPHTGWIESVQPAPQLAAQVLRAAAVGARIHRPGGRGPEHCDGTAATLSWTDPQLLVPVSSPIRPLISCADGILLGEMPRAKGGRLLVLSDPDTIANHSLGQASNARLALEVVAHARQPGQAVVIDETLHGHERAPSLWAELFVFPQLAAVIQGGLALFAFTWAGLARFGAPLPVAPPMGSGKGVLIENTASLLRSGGHSAYTLGRYLEAAIADVGRAQHAPAFARSVDQRTWMENLGRRRGVARSLSALERRVDRLRQADSPSGAAIVSMAASIHRWKEEMLRGPQRDPRG